MYVYLIFAHEMERQRQYLLKVLLISLIYEFFDVFQSDEFDPIAVINFN